MQWQTTKNIPMKRLILGLIIALNLFSFSQAKDKAMADSTSIAPIEEKSIPVYRDSLGNVKDDDTVYTELEIIPEFPGGMREMMTFISKHFHPTEEMIEECHSFRVVARFIVEKDGTLSNFEPYGRHPATRVTYHFIEDVLKKMPAFKPAMKDGKPVRCYYVIPLNWEPRY